MRMPCGQIIKGISGFFYVRTSTDVVQCKPRGVFKYDKKKITPIVGDYVEFEWNGIDDGLITKIKPRKTELIRPSISNVDQAVVVSSFRLPSFQPMNVDRFLVYGEYHDLRLVICITKHDLMEEESELNHIKGVYEPIGYHVIATSIYTGVGFGELQQDLSRGTSVLAGESGVGKSSLLQELVPNRTIQTGIVSQRLGRGKHTTKVVELIPLEYGGQVADTPGFSKLSLKSIPLRVLGDCFPEFRKYAPECYYRDCSHINEPRCEVLRAVQTECIHKQRYESYQTFYQEIKNERTGGYR